MLIQETAKENPFALVKRLDFFLHAFHFKNFDLKDLELFFKREKLH